MKVFLYDGNPGQHEWDELLGERTELQWDGENLCSEGERPLPGAGDTLICHRVQLEEIECQIKNYAANGIFVVEIGGDTRKLGQPIGNYYRRARGVGRTDHHFRACFRFFLERLEAMSTPEWHLLEGPPPPDALLAYHLLALLPDDHAAIEARQELAATAIAEAQSIAEATGTPALAQLEDAQERRTFLKQCS